MVSTGREPITVVWGQSLHGGLGAEPWSGWGDFAWSWHLFAFAQSEELTNLS